MSAKHRDPEYLRNRRVIRDRVKALHAAGQPAICWRGGGPIGPRTPYDVGHLPGARGHALHELAPEHRSAFDGCCRGNRAEGGRVGAMLTNRTPVRTVQVAQSAQSWKV